MAEYIPTEKTRVRRLPRRAVYDQDQVYSILDSARICHVGFAIDEQPYVIPTGYARVDDQIYIHGSAASRMLKTVPEQIKICVTVTLLDGLVLARSAFHHSMNYRSVIIMGTARLVDDPAEKLAALRAFTNHVVPGRWEEVRQPSEQELKATSVLAVPLREVSAKVRQGPPVDDEDDYSLPVWAGIIPLHTRMGPPMPDKRILPDVPTIDLERFTKHNAPER